MESLTKRVKEEILRFGRFWGYNSKLPWITCAARLNHHRLLSSVQRMVLDDVDLTSVSDEHLASLVSSVSRSVGIVNVRGCGLITILDSVKSRDLSIRDQSLGSEETQALVQAMESRVESIFLSRGVTMDIRDLMEYNGNGKCRVLMCSGDTIERYREKLRTWAMVRNWVVTRNDGWSLFVIERM